MGGQTDRRRVHGSHVTGGVGHVELEEEGAAILGVVRVQGSDWITSTSGDVVFPAAGEGRFRQREEGGDEAARVT